MMERIYIGDWLYNAGIVGFLRIILNGQDLDAQNVISIGENYIEFDRKILDGFSEKYFNFAFKRYGRYERVLSQFDQFRKDLENLKNNNLETISVKYNNSTEIPLIILERIQGILRNFSELKNKAKDIPSKGDVKNNPQSLEDFFRKMYIF